MNKNPQYRDWMVVINNPTMSDQELDQYLRNHEKIRYFVFAREKGDGTAENPEGTVHIHCYVECSYPLHLSTAKRIFSEESIGVNAHLEPRKESRGSCILYVKKEGPFIDKAHTRIGNIHEGGPRSESLPTKKSTTDEKLRELIAMRENGASAEEMFNRHPSVYLRFRMSIEQYIQDKRTEHFKSNRRTDLEVYYIYGEAGAGKTSYVMDKYGDANVCRLSDYGRVGKPCFDCYEGEDVLMFDEYDSDIAFGPFLQMIDVYKYDLSARYFNRTAAYTKVYIVSNLPIQQQYVRIQNETPKRWEALLRRIKAIYFFKELGDENNLTPVRDSTEDVLYDGFKESVSIYYDDEEKKYRLGKRPDSTLPPDDPDNDTPF